jgi:hypothetical protein
MKPSGRSILSRLDDTVRWTGIPAAVADEMSNVGVAQSAAAKCAIWSACAFTKDGRAVARAT